MSQIVYNVTVIIDHGVHEEWLTWMKEVHIPNVLASGQFLSSTMMRICEDEVNEDGISYAIHYVCKNIASYQKYKAEFAPILQKEVEDKFGGQFAAFRTLLEVVEHWKG